jgi:hypothetical protein
MGNMEFNGLPGGQVALICGTSGRRCQRWRFRAENARLGGHGPKDS